MNYLSLNFEFCDFIFLHNAKSPFRNRNQAILELTPSIISLGCKLITNDRFRFVILLCIYNLFKPYFGILKLVDKGATYQDAWVFLSLQRGQVPLQAPWHCEGHQVQEGVVMCPHWTSRISSIAQGSLLSASPLHLQNLEQKLVHSDIVIRKSRILLINHNNHM